MNPSSEQNYERFAPVALAHKRGQVLGFEDAVSTFRFGLPLIGQNADKQMAKTAQNPLAFI